MVLIGQYDSPFVRRVAIALGHYRIPFERKALSVFQDFNDMLAISPLGKVPVLILPSGDQLYDSRAIIEHLDGTVPRDRRLTPVDDVLRLKMLQVEAVAIGLAEKIYERGIEYARRQPGTQDSAWIERLERQIETSLLWLEQRASSDWIVGENMTRADLAVAVATTYVVHKQPPLFDSTQMPQLDTHRQKCEAMPLFSAAPYSASEALASGWRPEAH